jgi:hypothetical protein
MNTAMHRGAQLKMLYRDGFAPVAHTIITIIIITIIIGPIA